MAVEKKPLSPIARYPDGTYRMPSIHLNGGRPWHRYRVKDGDTWITLAQRDGWGHAMDLIDANFGTRDYAEINWYLREYVGCQVQDAKQDNYGFSQSARPGMIWTRNDIDDTPAAANLARNVIMALNFPADPLFHIRIQGWTLSPFIYNRVSNYVARGLIRVREQDRVDGADGEYVSETDTLYLRDHSLSFENRALIVHEATHAGFDLMAKRMRKAHSEALAYTAQCLYYQVATGRELGAATGDLGSAPIFAAANIIAREAYHAHVNRASLGLPAECFDVPDQYSFPLLGAINTAPRYKGSLRSSVDYDGIPDQYGER